MTGYSGRVSHGDPLTAAERQRRYRDKKNPNRGGPKVVAVDDLLVVCWCGDHMDRVPAETIRRGETWSCGAPNCKEAA